MHSDLPEPLPDPRTARVDETFVFCERVASRIKFVRRHIDYIHEKTDITTWLVRRVKGLPERGVDTD